MWAEEMSRSSSAPSMRAVPTRTRMASAAPSPAAPESSWWSAGVRFTLDACPFASGLGRDDRAQEVRLRCVALERGVARLAGVLDRNGGVVVVLEQQQVQGMRI